MSTDAKNKAANLHDWIVSRIHMDFTVMADNLLGDGIVTQEERIALSGAIGSALDAFNSQLDESLPQLHARRPWSEVIDTPEVTVLPAKYAVKALGGDRLGGYMVLWGDPNKRDLDGEYFTPETEELTAIFKAMGKLPFLYNHATDKTIKTGVVGVIDVMIPDDVGIWYEAQLDSANRYKTAIQNLARKQVLGTSSGTLPGARKVSKSGEILRWPIVEGSATTHPAETRMLEHPISEIKANFASIGLAFEHEHESDTPEDKSGVIRAKLGLLDLLGIELSSTIE